MSINKHDDLTVNKLFRKLHYGDCISVEGVLKGSQGKQQKLELHVEKWDLHGRNDITVCDFLNFLFSLWVNFLVLSSRWTQKCPPNFRMFGITLSAEWQRRRCQPCSESEMPPLKLLTIFFRFISTKYCFKEILYYPSLPERGICTDTHSNYNHKWLRRGRRNISNPGQLGV